MKQAIKKITAIMLIILILCTQTITFATDTQSSQSISVESARAQIANWAIAFKQSEGSKWIYKISDTARAATYNGGYPQNSYTFDCVGCVSYIIHLSIGINYSGAQSGISGFVTPQNNVRDTTHFEFHTISSNDVPGVGDVLIASDGVGGSTHNHVAIYCGGGKIVDIIRRNDTEIRTVTSNWEENGSSGCIFTKFARLKSVDGASFTPIEGGAILPSPSTNDSGSGNVADTDVIDLDEVAERFKYQGMPTEINSSEEENNGFIWFFNNLDGIWDYIAGGILTLIRAPVVGITSKVEAVINAGLHKASE